jgi:hypothetical protein
MFGYVNKKTSILCRESSGVNPMLRMKHSSIEIKVGELYNVLVGYQFLVDSEISTSFIKLMGNNHNFLSFES